MKKQRRVRYSRRPVFKRRRRRAFLIFAFLTTLALLAALALGGLRASLFSNIPVGTSGEPVEQIVTPTVEEAPEEIAEETAAEKKAAEEEAAKEEEEARSAAPDDPTLYLTVPRLGIYGHTVRNDRSEAALDLGAVKLPDTGFPWQKGSNTYIACHRLGWPGNESYHQCLNLPSMQKGDDVTLGDTNGRVYKYRVTDMVQVSPDETWVTEPVAGHDMVSLQTCIETYNDFVTLGPNWSVRVVVRADRVS